MTYQTATAKAGPLLFLAAAATLAAACFAFLFLVSILLSAAHLEPIRQLGAFSVIGLLVCAPLALASSLFVRCHACERLLLPLAIDGKSGGGRSPSAAKIMRTAVQVVASRRTACPHCGAETQV